MTSTRVLPIASGGMAGFHPLVVPHLEDLGPDDWSKIDGIGRTGSVSIHTRHPALSLTIESDDRGRVWLKRVSMGKGGPISFTRNVHHLDNSLPGKVPSLLMGQPLSILVDLPGAEKCTITRIRKADIHFSCDEDDTPWGGPDRPTSRAWTSRMQIKRLDGIHAERHSSLSASVLSSIPLEGLREYLRKRMRHPAGSCVLPDTTFHELGRITIPAKTRFISVEAPSGRTIVHRGKVVLEGTMPDAMRTGLVGRSARSLIDHPVFETSLVGRIEKRTDQSIIHLKSGEGTRDLGTIMASRPDAAQVSRIIDDLRKEASA